MTQVILDTHVLVWFVTGSARLSTTAKSILENENTDALISIASIWELAIKQSLGRMSLSGEFSQAIDRLLADTDASVLPITIEQCKIVSQLPLYHGDPFDRIIVSQALAHGLPLISADTILSRYEIRRIW